MNKLTLNDFLFSLNQDEDLLVTLVDYEAAIGSSILSKYWKSCLQRWEDYDKYKDYIVADFILSQGGLEITISKEDPDND